MTIKQRINEEYPDNEILIADGLDEAFIGIGQQFNKTLAVYDRNKVIEVLMEQGMTDEEAGEYFEYNVIV